VYSRLSMVAVAEGTIFGDWMPADPEAFQAFRSKWLATQGVCTHMQRMILAAAPPSDFRCRLAGRSLVSVFGVFTGAEQEYSLDGETHVALSWASIRAGGAFRYRCEELGPKRLAIRAVQPDSARSEQHFALELEADGRSLKLTYTRHGLSDECLLTRARPKALEGGRGRCPGQARAATSHPSLPPTLDAPRTSHSAPCWLSLARLPEFGEACDDCSPAARSATNGGSAFHVRRLLGGCFMPAEESAAVAAATAAAGDEDLAGSSPSQRSRSRSGSWSSKSSGSSSGSEGRWKKPVASRGARAALRRLRWRIAAAAAIA